MTDSKTDLGAGDRRPRPPQIEGVDFVYDCGCYWFCGNVVACAEHSPYKRADARAAEAAPQLSAIQQFWCQCGHHRDRHQYLPGRTDEVGKCSSCECSQFEKRNKMTESERSLRLSQIRERCEQTREGPWTLEIKDSLYGYYTIQSPSGRVAETWNGSGPFIAHAREDIPYLLDLVTDLITRLDRPMARGWKRI